MSARRALRARTFRAMPLSRRSGRTPIAGRMRLSISTTGRAAHLPCGIRSASCPPFRANPDRIGSRLIGRRQR